jgi:hypothetical protein
LTEYSDKVHPGDWRRGSPYDFLLEDEKFNEWIKNLRKRSLDTANERKKRFGKLHKQYGLLPRDFLSLGKEGTTSFLRKMVDECETGKWLTEEGKKFKPSTIRNLKKAVLAWMKENGMEITADINVSSRDDENEQKTIPKPDHVQRILNAATDWRQKPLISLMAFAGLREEVIGNPEGTAGLMIKDFPEMKIQNAWAEVGEGKEKKLVKVGEARVTFEDEEGNECIPTRIVIRQSLSKIKKQYQTFLNESGCTCLKQYLEWRMTEKTVRNVEGDQRIVPGEILKPESAAVTVTRLSVGRFMRRNQISGIIKDAIVAANYDYNPYLLRNFFIDAMEQAQRHDIIKVTDDRLFWSGQTPSIQATYTKFNKQADAEKLREMRTIYRQASDQYLIPPQHTFVDKNIFKNELRQEALIIDGMPPEEVYKLGDLSKKTPEEMQQYTQKASEHNPQPGQPSRSGARTSSEKNLKMILKSRLVNGEIDVAQYRQMKAELDR